VCNLFRSPTFAFLATLVARDLSFSYGPRQVLAGVSLTLAPGDRMGIMAPNGSGKSTLLRLLSAQLVPDGGVVERSPRRASVGYLHQEPERGDELGRDFVTRRTGVAAADAELVSASMALATGDDGADDRYSAALDAYLALGGTDLDARIDAMADRVGLPARALASPTSTLSGGEAARLQLVALLLSRFDILLLDEPTNDLDLAGLELLEQFVTGLDIPLAVVSHDRAFLSRVVNSVLELDAHTAQVTRFDGGWDAYQELTATAQRHAEERYETYSSQRNQLLGRAQREREWAAKGALKAKRKSRNDEKDKFITHNDLQSSEQLAARARSTEKRLERLETVDKPWEPWQLRMTFATAPRSGAVVATMRGAVAHQGTFTLGPVDLTVGWRERIGIVGSNGAGKSTLLGLLLGDRAPDEGDVSIGSGVVVGTVRQRRDHFDAAANVLEGFCAETKMAPADARTLLAKFALVGDHLGRPASSLSAGERSRAELALLMAVGVNLLVLDEPTNHLDLPAIEQLESALDSFEGTVIVVSHDRAFLDAVRLTRRLVLEGGRLAADQLVS
jgi:ATPase subunit of ABC transporter with duplicated ATPase domains